MEKQRWEESEKRRAEERRSEKRKSEKKEDAGARKGSKVAKHSVFPMICGSGGSKSTLAKAAGAEPFGQMRDEKLHTVVAAKHVWKSKCAKHTMFEVEMSKKCTPLWRKAHFQVKSAKKSRAQSTFGLSDVVSYGRRKGLCTLSKVSKTWGFRGSFSYNHHYITLRYTPLHYNYRYHYHYHYITLHYTTLIIHYTPFHSTPLRYTDYNYSYNYNCNCNYNYNYTNHTTLHYIPLHYTTLHSITPHYTTTTATATATTTLHYTNYITLH